MLLQIPRFSRNEEIYEEIYSENLCEIITINIESHFQEVMEMNIEKEKEKHIFA